MLQCGQSIRLTKADFEQLALLTQETPDPTVIKTVEQLNKARKASLHSEPLLRMRGGKVFGKSNSL